MMNIVNFAHGDFVMLGMYAAFVVFTLFGAGPLAGVPFATLLLAALGVVVYFGLIRGIMKGPMLAQILGTFGLALLRAAGAFGVLDVWDGFDLSGFIQWPSHVL
jgi:branched-chain amino acid transport system permease protein